MKTYRTYSSLETKKFGAELAKRVSSVPDKKSKISNGAGKYQVSREKKGALILALKGDLGAGKTTFAQGFLRELGVKRKITSPTFILIKRYKLKTKNYNLAFHIDCYRIKKPEELLDLGLQEILTDPRNIVLIEWPERLGRSFLRVTQIIFFRHGQRENERVFGVGLIDEP